MAYSGLLTDYLGEGLAADRPASPNLSPGACGVYYSTDTDVTSIWDGSTWHDLGSAGTVSSVALALPSSILTVSGSPVTVTGTLTGTLATQTANEVWAGPATGSAAAPTFRALTAADLPLGTTSDPGALQPDGTTIAVSGGVISATGGSGSVITPLHYANGGFVTTFYRGAISATSKSVALAANSPSCSPLRIPTACAITPELYISDGATASTAIALALFAVDTATGLPGLKIADFSPISLAVSGTAVSSTSLAVTAGDYYLYAIGNTSTPLLIGAIVETPPSDWGFIPPTGTGLAMTTRLSYTGTYSTTAPSTLIGVTPTPTGSTGLPYFFRVS